MILLYTFLSKFTTSLLWAFKRYTHKRALVLISALFLARIYNGCGKEANVSDRGLSVNTGSVEQRISRGGEKVVRVRPVGDNGFRSNSIKDRISRKVNNAVDSAVQRAGERALSSILGERKGTDTPSGEPDVRGREVGTEVQRLDERCDRGIRNSYWLPKQIGIYGYYPEGLGIDTVIAQRWGLGLQLGVGYDFKEKEAEPQVSLGYNLEKLTKFTHNTSLFVGRTIKAWTVGIRINL